MNMRRTVLVILSLLAFALAGGFIAGRYWPMPAAPSAAPILYTCPMHPEVVSNEPGTCPICGMALVPAQHEAIAPAAGNAGSSVIRISPEVMNNLNVRTAPVARATLWREARMPAYVQTYTPGGTLTVRAGIVGRVTAFAAKTPGRQRLAGESLAELAPAEGAYPSSPIKIAMPQDGEIIQVHAKVGDAVQPDTPLVTIRTMGQALVDVDIFQGESLWIKGGDPAELRLRHWPGHAWKGKVELESTRVNIQSRTYTARLMFPMAEGVVKIDMYGEARLFGEPRRNALAVPREALIRTENGARVVLALGDGRFRPVAVKPGIESGGRVEILSGVEEGDRVVVSAQFLLDSESNLRAEFQRLSAEVPPHPTPMVKDETAAPRHEH
jgi:Cu(I)/Ag(I) efflux system membrane fusion protein